MSSPAPPTGNGYYNGQSDSYNSKIMVAAIIILFVVVFFIFIVHLYAKWFWRQSSLYTISNRSPHRLNFVVPEVNPAAGHNVGLDKAAIDQLPTFIYKEPKTEQGLASSPECAVCLGEFQENEKARLLPACKHSFHTDCIDMWFYSHSTCPLCRTAVTPTLPSSTTSDDQQQQQGELLHQEEGNAMETPPSTYNDPPLRTAHERVSIYSTINHGNAIQYPNNVLFWGNQTQVISQLSFSQGSEKPSSSAPTRSIPQITVEIPTRQDTSPSTDQAYSPQPMKSPGLRLSIKRMLSRQSSKGNRVFGSNEDGGDSPKDTTTLPV